MYKYYVIFAGAKRKGTVKTAPRGMRLFFGLVFFFALVFFAGTGQSFLGFVLFFARQVFEAHVITSGQ